MGQVFLAPLLKHPKSEGMFLALLQGDLANSAGSSLAFLPKSSGLGAYE